MNHLYTFLASLKGYENDYIIDDNLSQKVNYEDWMCEWLISKGMLTAPKAFYSLFPLLLLSVLIIAYAESFIET